MALSTPKTQSNTKDHFQIEISPQHITSTSPRTGSVIGRVTIATPTDIQIAIDNARLGQKAWEAIGLQRRIAMMQNLRNAMYRNQELIVNTLVDELGKVKDEAQLEFLATIELVTYYLNSAPVTLAEQPVPVRLLPHRRVSMEHYPFGIVLVIAPWNYPLWLSMGPITAALIAGNAVIYKPSEYAAQIGEVMAGVIRDAGIPEEIFHILHGYGDTGSALIEAKPDRIVFTGSVPTGKKIAKQAADMLIPTTLELGGKDAAIVLDDADIPHTAEGIVWSGMFNAGQTCASIERVIVHEAVADQLITAMKHVIQRNLTTGNGEAPVMLGALTTPSQIDIVASQVKDALADGAKAITGGDYLPGAGRFYAPTLLTNVTPAMRVCSEETFGPVIVVMTAKDDVEAIALNNATVYGLTASIWTKNRQRALTMARKLDVGNVSVNAHLLTSGIPEAPWGGIKESGYGRTQGKEGLRDMTYVKVINVEQARLPFEPFWYPYIPFKQSAIRRTIDALYGPSLRDRLRALR